MKSLKLANRIFIITALISVGLAISIINSNIYLGILAIMLPLTALASIYLIRFQL